jgi:hypothetical protein
LSHPKTFNFRMYLSECVHLSIVFFENFLEFFWQLFSFILELDPFCWKALKSFYVPNILFGFPRVPNYLQSFPLNFWDSSGYIFRGLKIYIGFSRFVLSLKICFEKYFYFVIKFSS